MRSGSTLLEPYGTPAGRRGATSAAEHELCYERSGRNSKYHLGIFLSQKSARMAGLLPTGLDPCSAARRALFDGAL